MLIYPYPLALGVVLQGVHQHMNHLTAGVPPEDN